MSTRIEVVIAAEHLKTLSTLTAWLGAEGFDVAVAPRFAVAKELLDLSPDLVVSDLKLGEYNGLHLAARAKSYGIPVIVIGPRDYGLERDAHQVGALYVSSFTRRDLLHAVEHQLNASQVSSRRLGRPFSDMPFPQSSATRPSAVI